MDHPARGSILLGSITAALVGGLLYLEPTIVDLISTPAKPAASLEGVVVKETGTVTSQPTPRIPGMKPTESGKQVYLLTVETNEGKYVLDVQNQKHKPLTALESAIEPGTRIRFYIEQTGRDNYSKSYFSSDKIGSLPADAITVLGDQ